MDEPTPEQARRIAARILGDPDTRTLEELTAEAAQQAEDEPGAFDARPPWVAGGDDSPSLDGLASGCPDDGEPHNPWSRA